MSARLLGIGFAADMGSCQRKLVLLKLVDACEEDGTRIFPAVATIARAAQCSSRSVQRELKMFTDHGLLRLVREGGKGPGNTNEYALNLNALRRIADIGWDLWLAGEKGDTVSPLHEEAKGDTGDTLRVTQDADKGDKLCHPTPPDPSIDPSEEREGACADAGAQGRVHRSGLAKAPGGEPVPSSPEPSAGPDHDPDALFAQYQELNDRSAIDDEVLVRAAFDRCTPEEQREGVERQQAWLHHATVTLKAKHPPGGVRYWRDRLWQRLPEGAKGAEAKPEIVVAKCFSKLWWAILFRAVKEGNARLVSIMRDDARSNTGRGLKRGEEAAEAVIAFANAHMTQVPHGSPGHVAWSDWAETKGMRLPDVPAAVRWVFMPDRETQAAWGAAAVNDVEVVT